MCGRVNRAGKFTEGWIFQWRRPKRPNAAPRRPNPPPRPNRRTRTVAPRALEPAVRCRPGPTRRANRGPARPRTGSSLPTGPDPAVVFKYIKWGAGAIIVLLVVLILKSLLFSGRPSSASNAPTPTAPRGPVFTLVALKPVQVQVHRVGADGINNGEQVFSGTLNANETRVVPRPGAVFVDVNPPDSLLVEINGTRFPLPAGVSRSQLQAP
jgi:hypothetical protein